MPRLILAAALLLVLAALSYVPADASPPVVRHITGWTLVKGCPSPQGKKPMVLTIIFSDGTHQAVSSSDTVDVWKAAVEAIGTMDGDKFVFGCIET
jgi:hypothetical protein